LQGKWLSISWGIENYAYAAFDKRAFVLICQWNKIEALINPFSDIQTLKMPVTQATNSEKLQMANSAGKHLVGKHKHTQYTQYTSGNNGVCIRRTLFMRQDMRHILAPEVWPQTNYGRPLIAAS